MNDHRFSHITSDPRFKKVSHREVKVQIDGRFKHMFSDKKFKLKSGSVDKRGRAVGHNSSEDLRKYYRLSDRKTPDADTSNEGEIPDTSNFTNRSEGETPGTDNSDGETPDTDSSDGETPGSHSSSSVLSEGEAPAEVIHEWGRVSEVLLADHTTHRLALCNMDWDKINANDVYALANSFKPSGGQVERVYVYVSEFGQRRLADEEVLGPSAVAEEGVCQERLRQYQLERYQYYYAVIECDSVSTAENIYDQCDGLEYEHSGGQLDLRFIPDDVSFSNDEPVSTATELPPTFNPAQFVSKALQQSNVQLTWDETDAHRLHTTMRKFSKEDEAAMDFTAYLASDDEELHDPHKYRALLEEEVKGQHESQEMEISWEPGLIESTEKLLKKKKRDGLSRWEQYLQDKRSKKKKQKKCSENTKSSTSGFDDEFFQQTSVAGQQKRRKKTTALEGSPVSGELELLTMTEGGGTKGGDTVFNVTDKRFNALYESPHFAPDPAHPQYKHTETMKAIMKEKMRRRKMTQQQDQSHVEPLVNAVKRKTTAFKKHRKLQNK